MSKIKISYKDVISKIKGSSEVRINVFLLIEEMLTELGVDLLEADEFADRIGQKVLKYFESEMIRCEKKFIIPEFTIIDYNKNILIRSQYSFEKSQREAVSNKIDYRSKTYEALKNITWRDFELLATHILKSNRIKEIHVTQSSKDQGIDFYGFLEFEDLTLIPNRLSRDIKIRVVGQAKHSTSSNKVSHQKMSSFATEIRKLRKRQSTTYFSCLDDDFYQNDNPIVGIFLTNTSYTPKSENFANEYGIIIWDGEQLAEDLSIPEYLTKVVDENGEVDLIKIL